MVGILLLAGEIVRKSCLLFLKLKMETNSGTAQVIAHKCLLMGFLVDGIASLMASMAYESLQQPKLSLPAFLVQDTRHCCGEGHKVDEMVNLKYGQGTG